LLRVVVAGQTNERHRAADDVHFCNHRFCDVTTLCIGKALVDGADSVINATAALTTNTIGLVDFSDANFQKSKEPRP